MICDMRLLAFILPVFIASSAFARDPAQVRLFRKHNPCPATHSIKGACHGYVVDHIVPLCLGGPDKPANMQWQEKQASYAKDKIERAQCRAAKR